MAIYPIYNPETGERKEIEMSVHEIMPWFKSNKPWIRDWSDPSTAPGFSGEPGEWKDRLIKKHPDWNEVLKKVSKAPNSNVKKI